MACHVQTSWYVWHVLIESPNAHGVHAVQPHKKDMVVSKSGSTWPMGKKTIEKTVDRPFQRHNNKMNVLVLSITCCCGINAFAFP